MSKPIEASLQQKVHIRVSMRESCLSRSSPLQLGYTYQTVNRSDVNLWISIWLLDLQPTAPPSPIPVLVQPR